MHLRSDIRRVFVAAEKMMMLIAKNRANAAAASTTIVLHYIIRNHIHRTPHSAQHRRPSDLATRLTKGRTNANDAGSPPPPPPPQSGHRPKQHIACECTMFDIGCQESRNLGQAFLSIHDPSLLFKLDIWPAHLIRLRLISF